MSLTPREHVKDSFEVHVEQPMSARGIRSDPDIHSNIYSNHYVRPFLRTGSSSDTCVRNSQCKGLMNSIPFEISCGKHRSKTFNHCNGLSNLSVIVGSTTLFSFESPRSADVHHEGVSEIEILNMSPSKIGGTSIFEGTFGGLRKIILDSFVEIDTKITPRIFFEKERSLKRIPHIIITSNQIGQSASFIHYVNPSNDSVDSCIVKPWDSYLCVTTQEYEPVNCTERDWLKDCGYLSNIGSDRIIAKNNPYYLGSSPKYSLRRTKRMSDIVHNEREVTLSHTSNTSTSQSYYSSSEESLTDNSTSLDEDNSGHRVSELPWDTVMRLSKERKGNTELNNTPYIKRPNTHPRKVSMSKVLSTVRKKISRSTPRTTQ